jgi:hypothetical protein
MGIHHDSRWGRIRSQAVRIAKQIKAWVGGRALSPAKLYFESYGLQETKTLRIFKHILNPYRIPAVQRSREKPPIENAGGGGRRRGSPELRCESPAERRDLCPVTSDRRKLETTKLAEGEELDSNLLSQDFAPVRTTMVRGRKSQRKGCEIPQKIRRSAGAAKALSGNTSGSNDPLLNEQRTQFARLEYFSS